MAEQDHTILPVPIVPSARRVLANKPYLVYLVSSPVWVQSRGWCGIRRVLANKPYLVYLLMKMPLSLVSLMPSNLAALWVKHTTKDRKQRSQRGGDGRTARRHHTGMLRRGVWC